MINREITYERDVNKSYMKIPAIVETCLDEKLIFKKQQYTIYSCPKQSGEKKYNNKHVRFVP